MNSSWSSTSGDSEDGPYRMPPTPIGKSAPAEDPLLQRLQHGADSCRIDRWQIALDVHDDVHQPLRIESLQRLMDTVGTGLVIAARHHRLETLAAYGFSYGFGIGRHDHATKPALACPRRDVDYHRATRNVRQWLAWKPRRSHAGRDKDEYGHLNEQPKRMNRKWQNVSWTPPL